MLRARKKKRNEAVQYDDFLIYYKTLYKRAICMLSIPY